jgi:glycosyltransferase involved in cell wall biosynthesis
MHIINAMFSRGLGGIEQSFVDYSEAIKAQGHKVTAIIHPDAQIRPALVKVGVNIINVKNFGQWDIFAKIYLNKILKQTNPDAIIAHGNRAVELLKSPAKSVECPIIGVTHNYKLKRQIGLDAMFATTDDLKNELIKLGQTEETIYKVPNMIRLPNVSAKVTDFHPTPVIGTMGRFVKKKGFDTYLHAIAELKAHGIEFKAVIGGGGEQGLALKELADSLGINDNIKFLGWVTNKEQLFDNIDIFILPSLHEPFGIILLEAFMSGKPVITTASEGPSEIATNEQDALIVKKADSKAMAEAVIKLIKDPDMAKNLAKNGLKTVINYDLNAVGTKICDALLDISISKSE